MIASKFWYRPAGPPRFARVFGCSRGYRPGVFLDMNRQQTRLAVNADLRAAPRYHVVNGR